MNHENENSGWNAVTSTRSGTAADAGEERVEVDAFHLAPRTLLMTADAVGGVWNYSLELCRGLAEHDVNVVLATMGPAPSPEQRADANALRNVTLVEGDFRLEWMDAPWGDLASAGDWLLELEERYTPDLIHLNGYAHGALAWRAPTLMVGHSCVLSWWHAVNGEEAPPEWNRYQDVVRTGLHAADTVVAPSLTMLASLVRYYGALPRAEVIPNGCAVGGVVGNAHGHERAGVDAFHLKEPFVLSVGRLWDAAKNTATLARAARQIEWPVRVAGDVVGPAGAEAVGMSGGVELLGRCTPADLAGHYARAAIYALPARYEPFGLSVLEAALGGCALVLGDIASLRENWDGAAEFVPPNDSDALAACINTLAADEPRRRRLAARARARAAGLGTARMVDAYLAAYGRCLSAATHESLEHPVAALV